MRAVFGLVLIVGIALAGGAVFLAKKYMNEFQNQSAQTAEQAPAVPTTTVFVAERALRYGETLTKDAVRAVEWPLDAVPEGAWI